MLFVIPKNVIFLVFIYMVQFCTHISVTPCINKCMLKNFDRTCLKFYFSSLEALTLIKVLKKYNLWKYIKNIFLERDGWKKDMCTTLCIANTHILYMYIIYIIFIEPIIYTLYVCKYIRNEIQQKLVLKFT